MKVAERPDCSDISCAPAEPGCHTGTRLLFLGEAWGPSHSGTLLAANSTKQMFGAQGPTLQNCAGSAAAFMGSAHGTAQPLTEGPCSLPASCSATQSAWTVLLQCGAFSAAASAWCHEQLLADHPGSFPKPAGTCLCKAEGTCKPADWLLWLSSLCPMHPRALPQAPCPQGLLASPQLLALGSPSSGTARTWNSTTGDHPISSTSPSTHIKGKGFLSVYPSFRPIKSICCWKKTQKSKTKVFDFEEVQLIHFSSLCFHLPQVFS